MIPAENEEVIENHVDGTLVTEHVVELVEKRHQGDDVPDWAVDHHGTNHVCLLDVPLTEAQRVQRDRVVLVHAAFDTRQEMMSQIKAELPFGHVDQIGDFRPRVLIRSLQIIKTFPHVVVVVFSDVEAVVSRVDHREEHNDCESHC